MSPSLKSINEYENLVAFSIAFCKTNAKRINAKLVICKPVRKERPYSALEPYVLREV